MDWINEVQKRIKNKNQVLFSKDSVFLEDLKSLFREQNHRAMVLWTLDFAEESVEALRAKYPNETRPQEALEAAQDWAEGKIKMREAQRKILDCHAFAKEIDCKEDIATCHAIGQACAVVHTAGHAIGYPIYDLTSIVYKHGIEDCRSAIENRKCDYVDRLQFWNEHAEDYKGDWAEFLLK